MSEEKRDKGEEIAGKILTALLVAAAAWLLFRGVVGGIFSLIMRGNPENGVYVLFYGGAVVLLAVLGIGLLAGWLLWRSARRKPREQGEGSVFARGLGIGLAVVALCAALILIGFVRSLGH